MEREQEEELEGWDEKIKWKIGVTRRTGAIPSFKYFILLLSKLKIQVTNYSYDKFRRQPCILV